MRSLIVISQFSLNVALQRSLTILFILAMISAVLILNQITNRKVRSTLSSAFNENLYNEHFATACSCNSINETFVYSTKSKMYSCFCIETHTKGNKTKLIVMNDKTFYNKSIPRQIYCNIVTELRNLLICKVGNLLNILIVSNEYFGIIRIDEEKESVCNISTGVWKMAGNDAIITILAEKLFDVGNRSLLQSIRSYRENSCYARIYMPSHGASLQWRCAGYVERHMKKSLNVCGSFNISCSISYNTYKQNSWLNYLCTVLSKIINQKISFRRFKICNIVQSKGSYNKNISDCQICYKLVLANVFLIGKPRCNLQFTRVIKTRTSGGKMIVIDYNATRVARANISQTSANGEFSIPLRIKKNWQNRSTPVKIFSLDKSDFNTEGAKEITTPTMTEPQSSIPDGLEMQMVKSFSPHSFNVTASDSLLLNRTIPSFAPESCRMKIDLDALPVATIVICFHNEALSVLLRTVWSALFRSPSSLVKEIILVDDASTLDLGKPLEAAIANWEKVKITKTPGREGLIRARLIGARKASGDILVFLDSHCECNVGWLEPLAQRIKDNHATVVCPEIDIITADTFEYIRTPENLHGYFTWNLDFEWKGIPFTRKLPSDPVSTPVMVGGIFAVKRDYFFDIGTYDEQMEIWGGENVEMSFRIWMCGGTIEILPCSRVGHVYRSRIPYTFPKDARATIRRNKARVAEVWMDDFKMFYFGSDGVSDTGDLQKRHKLRKDLRCHDFRWYLNNVIPELPLPSNDAIYFGEVRNELKLLCLEAKPSTYQKVRRVTLGGCHGNMEYQHFVFTTSGRFRLGKSCLYFDTLDGGGELTLVECDESKDQIWEIKEYFIFNVATTKCLTVRKSSLQLQKCACTNCLKSQHWTFSNFFDTSITNRYREKDYSVK